MKLNLGSGWHRMKGYKNVDLYYDADIKADLRTVEFPEGTIDEVIAVHVIEHFTREDGLNLIERCYHWLKPGARLILEWPDQAKCRELMSFKPLDAAKGLMGGRSVDKDGWHAWLAGWAQRGADLAEPIPDKWNLPGEQHLYVWGGKELAKEFQAVGFRDVQLALPHFHGRQRYRDSQVSGMKPHPGWPATDTTIDPDGHCF